MNFQERKLYHQLHPVKLATDTAATFPFLYLLWHHHILWALCCGFLPPVLISAIMMKWPPDLEKIGASRAGRYLRTYMTPTVEAVRLLTLVPMAYGAWNRQWWPIGAGMLAAAKS